MVARGQVDLHLHHHPDYHYHYHYHRFHYHRNQHQDGVDPEYLLVAGDRGGGGRESGGGDDEKVNTQQNHLRWRSTNKTKQQKTKHNKTITDGGLQTKQTKQNKSIQNHHRWRCCTTM